LLRRLSMLVGISVSRKPRGQSQSIVPPTDTGDDASSTSGDEQSRPTRQSVVLGNERTRGLVALTIEGDVDVSLFEARYIQLHHGVRLGNALDIDQANCLKALGKLHHESLTREMRRNLVLCVGYDTIPSQRSMSDYQRATRAYELTIQDGFTASGFASDPEIRTELATCYLWLARGSLARGNLDAYRGFMSSALLHYERAACLRSIDAAILCNWGVALAEWATVSTVYQYAQQGTDGWARALPVELKRRWYHAMVVAVRRFQWALLVSPIQYTALDYWSQFQALMLNTSPLDARSTATVTNDVELLAIQLSARLLQELLLVQDATDPPLLSDSTAATTTASASTSASAST
jgi:hypothetical protein